VGHHRRAGRARVVVGVPSVASPGDLAPGSDPVPGRAVPVLRLPRTRAARRLLMLGRADVEDAAARIEPLVVHTPVLSSLALDVWLRASVFVKAEHQQHTGAFKFRGATNAVQSLEGDEAARGVAAHSSGNHAAALACAARERGIPAYVVMPRESSPFKISAV